MARCWDVGRRVDAARIGVDRRHAGRRHRGRYPRWVREGRGPRPEATSNVPPPTRSSALAARSNGVSPAVTRSQSRPRSLPTFRNGGGSFSCWLGLAPASRSMPITCSPVVLSSAGKSGRPPRGSVLTSTAKYRGARPHRSHLFGFGAAANQRRPPASKCMLRTAMLRGRVPSGSGRASMPAPAATSQRPGTPRTPGARQRARGVSPPAGRYNGAGLARDLALPVVHGRAQVHARHPRSIQLAAPRPRAPAPTAHISADWPCHCSVGVHPGALPQQHAAPHRPVRCAPPPSAPSVRRRWATPRPPRPPAGGSSSTALPVTAASNIGVEPNEFFTFTPRAGPQQAEDHRIARSAAPPSAGPWCHRPRPRSRRPPLGHQRAVRPPGRPSSRPRPAGRRHRACRPASPPALQEQHQYLQKSHRERPLAVAGPCRSARRRARAASRWEIGPAASCIRYLQVLVALPASRTPPPHDHDRQRELVVCVAVAHVAAIQQDRVIQHRPVAVGHLRPASSRNFAKATLW